MTTYVAIDLETTGLDPFRDEIIEVAAVTFAEGQILDEFTSLIRPRGDIPPFITELTGITSAMVADAPSLRSLRNQLRQTLGDHTIVGHNVGFDLGFLAAIDLGARQPRLDTVTLASILMPGLGRYSLEAVARHLQLPSLDSNQAHRALADARLVVELFAVLEDQALQLDFGQLDEIVRVGRNVNWSELPFFEIALRRKGREAFGEAARAPRRLFRATPPTQPALTPADHPAPLDVDLIADLLYPEGNFARQFPDYEYREEQVDMLVAVAEAFNGGEKLLVEAGTGTGKSLGYLLPAAFWATQNGRRVLVATATINLQDQLVNKDIPALQQLLPFELRAAVLKGKRNYLCTRLFQQLRHSGPRDADEMTLFARIVAWLPFSASGDVAEMSLRGGRERLIWGRLSAENDVCSRDTCAQENCPLHIARRRAEQAHIVVVNHALLLADVGFHFLPGYLDLVVDEAHHLESAVTDGLSFRADRRFLDTLLEDVTGRSGLVADVEGRTRLVPPAMRAAVDGYINELRQVAAQASEQVAEFFQGIEFYISDQIRPQSPYSQSVRLTPPARKMPDFDVVEVSWDGLGVSLKRLGDNLAALAENLTDLIYAYDIEDGEELQLAVQSRARELAETRANLRAIIAEPKADMIYWVEWHRERLSLHAAPLHVGPLVEEHIFNELEAVVLTSATLRTAGAGAWQEPSFGYIRERLHAFEALELALGSPFDFPNRALLYLVSDMPEPNQPGYQRYVEQAILDVATTLGGRTLVLFTSYGQLNQTARAIGNALADASLTLLAQTEGASRQQLLEHFKQPAARAVLLGTRSFWEGVDVPGAALQAVILVKIPFDVPSDPIFAARAETFDNSFYDYSVPEAVLRFRQGFGRLLRRQDDEGVVVVLDKRVLSKRYGQQFLDALPPCTVIRQRHDRLGEIVLRWFNRQR